MAHKDQLSSSKDRCDICGAALDEDSLIQGFPDGSVVALCADCAADAGPEEELEASEDHEGDDATVEWSEPHDDNPTAPAPPHFEAEVFDAVDFEPQEPSAPAANPGARSRVPPIRRRPSQGRSRTGRLGERAHRGGRDQRRRARLRRGLRPRGARGGYAATRSRHSRGQHGGRRRRDTSSAPSRDENPRPRPRSSPRPSPRPRQGPRPPWPGVPALTPPVPAVSAPPSLRPPSLRPQHPRKRRSSTGPRNSSCRSPTSSRCRTRCSRPWPSSLPLWSTS